MIQVASEVDAGQADGDAALIEYSSYTGNKRGVDTEGTRGSDFSSDGSRFYVLGRTSKNIVEYRLSDEWNIESADYVRELSIAKEMGSRNQPDNASNGFFIRKDGRRMWVFNRTEIWEYSLSSAWNIASADPTGYKDLSDDIVRGHDVDFRPDGRVLYIDDRAQKAVLQFSLSSAWDIESASLDEVLDISDQQEDEGVRGIQFSPDGDRMYLNDTAGRKVLEYFLSDPYDIDSADYTGSYSVSSQVNNAEGFSFRSDNSMFYLSSTGENVIYQYRISALDDEESTVTADPEKTTANGIATSRITVTARTPDGDRIAGLRIDLDSNSGNSEIDAVNSKTNSDGEAIFEVSNSEVETVTFTASGLGTKIDQSASVEFVSLDAEESSLASNRGKVVANGNAAARVTVTARDEDGDTIEGVEINLESNSGTAIIDGVRERTNSDGEAIFDVSNTVAETATFSANSMGTTINQTVSVRFVTVDAEESSVSVNRQRIQANGSESSIITVIARDEDGDELEGLDISLNQNGGSSDIDTSESETDSDGVAEFRVTNTVAETVMYSATGYGVTIDEEVSVTFIPIDPSESTVGISTQKILANGKAEATITVTAKDEDGDPFSNVTINLNQNGGNSTITKVQPETDSDGIAIFRVKNNNTGQITYSANALGVTIAQTVSPRFVTVNPAQSTVVVNPQNVQANGSEQSQITVTTRDGDGDELQGASVRVDALNGNSSIDATEKITNSQGEAVFTVTSSTPQIVDYKITAEGNEFPENASVGFIPIAPVALAATDIQTRQFRANWEMINGAESYLIDVATDDSFNNLVGQYNALDVGNVTSFTVDNLSPGTTYFYRVRATKDGLIGANSQLIQTTTFPDTPNATAASDRNALKFTANWDQAEGARKYRLDVARDASFNDIISGNNNLDVGTSTSYTVENLAPGETYFYRVRAEAGPRISGNSEVIETSTLTISSEESEIASSQLRVLANGNQPNQISIVVRSDGGILLEGLQVSLSPGNGSSEVEGVQPVTNDEGVAKFNVTNTQAEAVEFSVVVENIGIGTIRLEFVADDGVLRLGNNFPNPFLVRSKIPVTVPRNMRVELRVFNSLGAPVQTLLNKEVETGYYEIPFDGSGLAAGIYFYRLIADGEKKTLKMVLIK